MGQRQSNIELLRIVSMAMIVMFHGNSVIEMTSEIPINQILSKAIWTFGGLGDDIFMLISGYFMVTGHFKWKKLILLVLEVQFYYWLATSIGWAVGASSPPTGTDLFLAFFPVITNRWWFITAYILVYLFSPYLNSMTQAMDNKNYKTFLLTVLTPFCFIPTFFGVFYGTTEGLLYYNGFIWLTVMYLIGGFLRRVDRQLKDIASPLTIASASVIGASIVVITYYGGFTELPVGTNPLYLRLLNNVPMVCLSAGIFGMFLKADVPQSKLINRVASTALGIYLLSENSQLRNWIWFTVFRLDEHQGSPYVVLRLMASTAIIMTVCIAVDLVRRQVENKLVGIYDRWRCL